MLEIAALTCVIVFGIPHGALDGEVARPMLRPRFGVGWFAVFAVPYLCLAFAVLLAWRAAPLMTLAGFLALSVWHFGIEDAGPRPLDAFVAGGLPIAAPVLTRPAETAHLLGTIALSPLGWPPVWLMAGSVCWLGAFLVWIIVRLDRRLSPTLFEPAVLVCLFVTLPPLFAFALYFVGLHAPRHMKGLMEDRGVERVVGWRSAVLRSLPITLLTVLMGAGLWRFTPGAAPDRLLTVTLQGLAALTLPHVLLNDVGRGRSMRTWAARLGRRPGRRVAASVSVAAGPARLG